MITFRCTKKVRDLLGLAERDLDDESDGELYEWFVETATIERYRCLLFTHKLSLYSFWALAVRKPDLLAFDELFQHHALAMLKSDGYTDVEIARLLPRIGHRFAKALKRHRFRYGHVGRACLVVAGGRRYAPALGRSRCAVPRARARDHGVARALVRRASPRFDRGRRPGGFRLRDRELGGGRSRRARRVAAGRGAASRDRCDPARDVDRDRAKRSMSSRRRPPCPIATKIC